jgi:ABC-2 type transport system ATP-binding protein
MISIAVIEFRHLTKRFGDIVAVDDLTAVVRPGVITGFLGPNGAGKTTTLRMLLGLIAPTSGAATINGHQYHTLVDPIRQVGAALEASGFHPSRSARDHLRWMSVAAGLPVAAADRALDAVGLQDAARRPVGQFSLGMRQRLELASAMLGDPPVVVLDEPANGLDPQGIRWLRGFLRQLASAGRTVLVSSHVLAEIEQIADDVLILAHGRLLRSGGIAQLRAGATLTLAVSPDAPRLRAVLEHAGHTVNVVGDGELRAAASPEVVGEAAAAHGIVLHRLQPTGGLEEAFLQLTEETAP